VADRYSCHVLEKKKRQNGVMTRQSTEEKPIARHADVKPMACRLQTWMDADGSGLFQRCGSRSIPCSCHDMSWSTFLTAWAAEVRCL
jgi:hypothetical protein